MRPVKLLIDENLSPAVALRLREDGFDVVHVRERGLLAGTDVEVFKKAFEEDRIVLTSNFDDFLALAGAFELHAGVVLVEDGALLRNEQEQVIRRALAAIEAEYAAGRDVVNRVLLTDSAGKLEFVDVPPGSTD